MKSKYLFLGVVVALLLTAFAPGKTNSLVNDVLEETNLFRKSKALKALAINEELNEIAQKHSENMASGRVSFGHAGFEKRNTLAVESISSISSFAENVAFGATSGKDVVAMWKNSSGHRRNMLGKFTYIGIGIAKDKQGRIYYTQIFAG